MRQETDGSGAAPLNGAHILAVEDDFLLRLEIETVLRDAGAAVVRTCGTVQQALVATDTEGFGMAILDTRLGYETVAPVARRLAEIGTPFIFYTGQVAGDAVISQWPQARVISKPAVSAVLVDAVADVLSLFPAPRGSDQ